MHLIMQCHAFQWLTYLPGMAFLSICILLARNAVCDFYQHLKTGESLCWAESTYGYIFWMDAISVLWMVEWLDSAVFRSNAEWFVFLFLVEKAASIRVTVTSVTWQRWLEQSLFTLTPSESCTSLDDFCMCLSKRIMSAQYCSRPGHLSLVLLL